jgi:hypothetical protein
MQPGAGPFMSETPPPAPSPPTSRPRALHRLYQRQPLAVDVLHKAGVAGQPAQAPRGLRQRRAAGELGALHDLGAGLGGGSAGWVRRVGRCDERSSAAELRRTVARGGDIAGCMHHGCGMRQRPIIPRREARLRTINMRASSRSSSAEALAPAAASQERDCLRCLPIFYAGAPTAGARRSTMYHLSFLLCQGAISSRSQRPLDNF